MGKLSCGYMDSDTEDTSSSMENVKKKTKLSILKRSSSNVKKKKKCKIHRKSDPEEIDVRRIRSSQKVKSKQLHGILKYEREYSTSEDDEDEFFKPLRMRDRCLVGQVPRPVGAKPGRGGGVAIIVKSKRDVSNLQPENSCYSTKKKKSSTAMRWLNRKRSY